MGHAGKIFLLANARYGAESLLQTVQESVFLCVEAELEGNSLAGC